MERLFLLLLATSAHALIQSARVQRASQLRAQQASMKDDQLTLSSERQQQQHQDGPVAWRWISGDGRRNSWMDVLSHTHLAEQTRNNVEVHVACDSAVQGRFVVFATVVCVIAKGQAGRYFYSRLIEEKRQYPVLQTRLLREVQLSLDTAEALKLEDVAVAQVHCDSNTDPGAKSTEHTRMLTGYIQSMGCMSSAPQLHHLRRGALRTRNAPPPDPRFDTRLLLTFGQMITWSNRRRGPPWWPTATRADSCANRAPSAANVGRNLNMLPSAASSPRARA